MLAIPCELRFPNPWQGPSAESGPHESQAMVRSRQPANGGRANAPQAIPTGVDIGALDARDFAVLLLSCGRSFVSAVWNSGP